MAKPSAPTAPTDTEPSGCCTGWDTCPAPFNLMNPNLQCSQPVELDYVACETGCKVNVQTSYLSPFSGSASGTAGTLEFLDCDGSVLGTATVGANTTWETGGCEICPSGEAGPGSTGQLCNGGFCDGWTVYTPNITIPIGTVKIKVSGFPSDPWFGCTSGNSGRTFSSITSSECITEEETPPSP